MSDSLEEYIAESEELLASGVNKNSLWMDALSCRARDLIFALLRENSPVDEQLRVVNILLTMEKMLQDANLPQSEQYLNYLSKRISTLHQRMAIVKSA